MIGSAYVEIADFTTPAEFLAALRAGVVVGHHWDEPRQWSARIVPSVYVLVNFLRTRVRNKFTRTSGQGTRRMVARPSWAAAATIGASRAGTAS